LAQWKSFTHASASLTEAILYKDRVVPARFTKPEKRFRVLFKDIFGHHIQLDSTKRIGAEVDVLEGDSKRLIEQDEVSALFREKFVNGFLVAETANECLDDLRQNLLDPWQDISEVCDPSVAFPYRPHKGFGNNRLSLIIGNAGQGKSLLLTKVLSDRAISDDADAKGRMLIAYVNMESAWVKDGEGIFKDIDDSFWKLLFDRLIGQLPRNEATVKLRDFLLCLAGDSILSWEYKLRDACRTLPEHGYYATIVIDNVDRYHFSEVRHSFFEEYKQEQSESIQRNIARVISKFNDLDALGRISASVVIVCRRPVYDHLMLAADGSDPNDNRLKGYSAYQILEPGSSQIVSPRLNTLKYIIDREIKLGRLPTSDIDAVKAALSILKSVTVERTEGEVSHDGLTADVFDLLLDLSHQGPRGVIQFFSEFEFDVRKNAEAIDRVFRSQPRNLLRLYISNCKKRYSQANQHFPNLFLIDCVDCPDSKYPSAYLPHRQTYWLKWIVLRLIDGTEGGVMSFEDLYAQLSDIAGYEDHLIRLVIGSLATPNKAGCISVRYRNHTIGSRELSLTKRGAALVREQHTKVLMGVPFCFSFDYLQLVSDDPQMTYPAHWSEAIVPPGISLDYTLRERDEYHRRALEYLRNKMPATLVFVQLLESSWCREAKFLRDLDQNVLHRVTPNFQQIRETLLGAYKAILVSWSDEKDSLFADLSKKSEELRADKSFQQFWEVFGD
jgi:hypothetical protein